MPLGRLRHRWDDIIQQYIGETRCVCVCVDWIKLAKERCQWGMCACIMSL
jgi:hypothetical protein